MTGFESAQGGFRSASVSIGQFSVVGNARRVQWAEAGVQLFEQAHTLSHTPPGIFPLLHLLAVKVTPQMCLAGNVKAIVK